MKTRYYVSILSDGKLGGGIITNDYNVVIPKDYVEITDDPNCEIIIQNQYYYKYIDDEIVELTKLEKEKVDKKMAPPKPTNIVEDKLKELETKLLALGVKVDTKPIK